MIQAQGRHAAAMARVKAREDEAKLQHSVAMAKRKARKEVEASVAVSDEHTRQLIIEVQTAAALEKQRIIEAEFENRVLQATAALDEQARLLAQSEADVIDKESRDIERRVRSEMEKHRMSAKLLADDENLRAEVKPVIRQDQHEDFLARVTVEELARRYHSEKKAKEQAQEDEANAKYEKAQKELRDQAKADDLAAKKRAEEEARRKADALGVSLSASSWYTESPEKVPAAPPKPEEIRGDSSTFEALFMKGAEEVSRVDEGEAHLQTQEPGTPPSKVFSAFSAFTATTPSGARGGAAISSGSSWATEATKAAEERQQRLKRNQTLDESREREAPSVRVRV